MAIRTRNQIPAIDRFRGHVIEGPAVSPELGPCHLWTASLYTDGYGKFWVDGKTVRAHRWALKYAGIRIPEGFEPDHLCKVRRCVRTAHMEVVTKRENLLRAIALRRGRPVGLAAINKDKTQCHRGHEFTPENTRTYRGKRHCRKCACIHAQDKKQRKLAG